MISLLLQIMGSKKAAIPVAQFYGIHAEHFIISSIAGVGTVCHVTFPVKLIPGLQSMYYTVAGSTMDAMTAMK